MSLRRRDHALSRRLALAAYHHQGRLYHWCQVPMLLVKTTPSDEPRLMTADHLVPVYAGGLTIAGNIVAACYQCNNGRHREETNRIKPGATIATAGDPGSFSPFEVLKMLKPVLAIVALVAFAGVALAQQTTLRDASGRTIGRSVTDSQGSSTLYDAAGRVQGRSSTDSQGTTTFRDASGRALGSASGGIRR